MYETQDYCSVQWDKSLCTLQRFQLVVEMRTQELHRLREERARHMQQLEELDDTRNRLAKMQAKVEDLQAQLETKVKVERYLLLMDN